MTETLSLDYVVCNQTSSELNMLLEMGLWLRSHCEPNTYGFDLRSNTWKFAREEDRVLFLLTWAVIQAFDDF